MSDSEVEKIGNQGQAFILSQIILRSFFKQAMGMLFGSIIMLQILAHVPLSDIYLPANARQQFDIMIEVVSFDYFPLTDLYDFGFTETLPWN